MVGKQVADGAGHLPERPVQLADLIPPAKIQPGDLFFRAVCEHPGGQGLDGAGHDLGQDKSDEGHHAHTGQKRPQDPPGQAVHLVHDVVVPDQIQDLQFLAVERIGLGQGVIGEQITLGPGLDDLAAVGAPVQGFSQLMAK